MIYKKAGSRSLEKTSSETTKIIFLNRVDNFTVYRTVVLCLVRATVVQGQTTAAASLPYKKQLNL